MAGFFKGLLKGIINILLVPFYLVLLAMCSCIGLVILVFLFFKSLFLFFTGRSLKDDLKEDIQAKKIKQQAIQKLDSAQEAENTPKEAPPVIETHNESTNIERSVTNNIYINTNGQPVSEDLLKLLSSGNSIPQKEETKVIEELPKEETKVIEDLPVEQTIKPLEIEEVEEVPLPRQDTFINDPFEDLIEETNNENEEEIEEYIPHTNSDNVNSIFKKGDK